MGRPQLDLSLDPNYQNWTIEEKEADRQRWRRENGRIPGQSQPIPPKQLELDANYNNWTAEEKEADRQKWRRDNGRISVHPLISPKKLQLDPNYQNWTAEQQEADRLRWRIENGRLSASALQETLACKLAKKGSVTMKTTPSRLVVLYGNEAQKEKSGIPAMEGETKDSTRNSYAAKRRQIFQHQKAIKEEPESATHRSVEPASVKKESVEPETRKSVSMKQKSPYRKSRNDGVMSKEARIKASLERCEIWLGNVEAKQFRGQHYTELRNIVEALEAQKTNL